MIHRKPQLASTRRMILAWLLVAAGAAHATPQASPASDTVSAAEDFATPITVDLSTYFTDPAVGHSIQSYHLVSGPAAIVSVSMNNTSGMVTLTAVADAAGSEILTFEAVDNVNNRGSFDLTVNVTPVNDPPTFTPGSDQTVSEDAGAQTVVWASGMNPGGGSDESGQSLFFGVTNDNNALFAVQPAVNSATGDLTYTPAADAHGSAVVTVELTDNGGGANASPLQTFNIDITGVNDPPVFAAGPDQTVPEDAGAQTVNGWATGIGPGGGSDESGQNLTFNVSNDNNALFSAQPDVDPVSGDLTFTPVPDANGTALVTATLSDDAGGTSAPQTFSVDVGAVNDPPAFTAGGDQTVAEDAGAQTVSGWATGMSPGPANESTQALSFNVTNDNNGLFTTQPSVDPVSGDLTFTPAPDAIGTAVVTVVLTDSGGGTNASAPWMFNIDVTAVNDAPVFAVGPDQSVPEDAGPQTASGWATGVGAGGGGDESTQNLTFNVSNDNNALFSAQPAIDPATGDLTFTSTPNANGAALVTVTLSDDGGGSNTSAPQNFTITVGNVNDPPSFNAGGNQVALEDAGAVTVPGWATGMSPGPADESAQNLTFNVVNITNAGLFAGVPTVDGVSGDLTFVPAPDANGTADITLNVSDDGGGATNTSGNQTFTIDVTAVNDAPTFNAGPDVTVLEDVGPHTVNNWATGISPGAADEASQTLSFTVVSNSNPGLFSAGPAVDPTGTLTFTPTANANGSATITLRLSDDGGNANGGASVSTDQTFAINVTAVDDPADAVPDSATMLEDDPPILISVLANDDLAEEPTTIIQAGAGGFSESAHTTIVDPNGDSVTAPNGRVTIVGNQIEYQPKADFFGDDWFTYTIQDSDGDTDTARVDVRVDPVNDAPHGVQQRSYSLVANTSLTVDATTGLKAGAYDVDHAPGSIQISAVTPPPLGMVIDLAAGTFTYTPPTNFIGTVIFTYRLDDGTDLSPGTAYEARITVLPPPTPPPAPPPGQVAIPFDLANVPLEQSTSVPPNVLVIMDDSASMDWNMIVSSGDENGTFLIDNRAKANRSEYVNNYVYLWGLSNNVYPWYWTGVGTVLPTQEALDNQWSNNEYGVWRARNHLHNPIYYNPEINYTPWVGQDDVNQPFTNANPSAIRLDPTDPGDLFDMLSNHSYNSYRVPDWDNDGGTTTLYSVSVYIPHYYTTTATAPLAWNDPHTKVVIKSGQGPLPGGDFPGGPDRQDCAVGDNDPTDCTYAQEIQNFANYFQYYRNREYVAKNGIGKVVSQLQDIRVGYDTINHAEFRPIRDMNALHTEGEKEKLMDTIYAVDSLHGTPLRSALDRAGQIFSCTAGLECPALPAPEGFCQQNFSLLFSDGYWNGNATLSGNLDSNGTGPWDGGRYADTHGSTLADVAMHYYETDVQPGLTDQVPAMRRDVDGAPPGALTGTDPRMHQHMKTYTIAFGVVGTKDPTTIPTDPTATFNWPNPSSGPLEKIDDMLHAAVNGRGTFLNASNPQALQSAFEAAFLEFTQATSSTSSAAFNSTSLQNGTLLYRGFFDLRENTGELTATMVNPNGTLQTTPTWSAATMLDGKSPGSRVIVTYDPSNNAGTPFRFASLTPAQQSTVTAEQVDYLRGVRTAEDPNGALRKRPTSQGLLGDIVNSSPVFVGTPRAINRDQAPYPTGGTNLYSSFVSAKASRTPVVYVGANDGMLHGFHALTGDELFAYVPNKILDSTESYASRLNEFTSPFYQHNFYVDLTPRLNDVFMRASSATATKSWNTVLLGGLGAGGKGFYALNVTNPDTAFTSEANAAGTVLWEFTDEDDTYPVDGSGNPLGGSVGAYTDPQGKPIKDLGYALSLPLVTMSNASGGGSNKWVAIFGNGPNSTAGIAKLFVLFMDDGLNGWGAGDFLKIDTGYGVPSGSHPLAGYPNGLGTPAIIDQDLNGTADLVYAGDRLGNLFRFDLRDPNPNNWTSTRLFTAEYNTGSGTTVQPILSEPLVVKHPSEPGFLVIFGTGSHITRSDADNEDIQSIYAIWDRGVTVGTPATANTGAKYDRLVEQTITNVVDDSGPTPLTRRIVSQNPVNYQIDGASPGTYGWYIDLDMPRATSTLSGGANSDTSGRNPPGPQFPGEKAIRRLLFRDGTVLTTTVLPSLDEFSCFGPRPGSLLVFDAYTGGDAGRPLIDFNNDQTVDQGDLVTVGGVEYSGGVLFDQSDFDGPLVDLSVLGSSDGGDDTLFISGGNDTLPKKTAPSQDDRTGRLSWRELN